MRSNNYNLKSNNKEILSNESYYEKPNKNTWNWTFWKGTFIIEMLSNNELVIKNDLIHSYELWKS